MILNPGLGLRSNEIEIRDDVEPKVNKKKSFRLPPDLLSALRPCERPADLATGIFRFVPEKNV